MTGRNHLSMKVTIMRHLAVGLVLTVSIASGPLRAADLPNIVLIDADDLRQGDAGYYTARHVSEPRSRVSGRLLELLLAYLAVKFSSSRTGFSSTRIVPESASSLDQGPER